MRYHAILFLDGFYEAMTFKRSVIFEVLYALQTLFLSHKYAFGMFWPSRLFELNSLTLYNKLGDDIIILLCSFPCLYCYVN